MPRRFKVHSMEGRLTPSLGGSRPPNRISRYLSALSEGWLTARQRPHVQLPAPTGGWMRYALTLTPESVYVRCQAFNGDVLEQLFTSPIPRDEDYLLTTRVDHYFKAWNEVYRRGLERAYGWPQNHRFLPVYLPQSEGKTIMEAHYSRYSNLTLVLGSHHLLLTGWSAHQSRPNGYGAQDTVPCTNQPFILLHPYRWRGIADEYIETPTLLKQAAMQLSAPWPLTGNEGM